MSSVKGKEKGGDAPWTSAEFYEFGRQDWEQFRGHWERYGLDRESCVEIGCGAGRITMHLARTFGAVHAVDVAESMIAVAREHVDAPGVTFHLGNGVELPLADGSTAAVFSTHVFQNFDSVDVATAYFAEIARVLRPGGSLMIHLPVHRWPAMGGLFELTYGVRKRAGAARAWGWRQLLRAGVARPMRRYLSYPVDYLFTELPRHGLDDVEVQLFAPRPSPSVHPFVLARKGPA